MRDYDSAVGKYSQSDPMALRAGINTYAYVDSSPLMFSDPSGLGKQGGQTNIGGDDPLIPKDIGKNSSPDEIAAQIKKIEDAMCDLRTQSLPSTRLAHQESKSILLVFPGEGLDQQKLVFVEHDQELGLRGVVLSVKQDTSC